MHSMLLAEEVAGERNKAIEVPPRLGGRLDILMAFDDGVRTLYADYTRAHYENGRLSKNILAHVGRAYHPIKPVRGIRKTLSNIE
jgi:hypothetical protein